MFAIALEVLCLSESRRTVLENWKSFEKDGLYQAYFRDGSMGSPPINYLRDVHHALNASLAPSRLSINYHMRDHLCDILRSTPMLVHKRDIVPMKELDIQEVMNDYLQAFYPSLVKEPKIARTSIRQWLPDCGIKDLGVAIEFKYANSDNDAKQQFCEILEDAGGYSGSKDWARFIVLIY